ncbi:MAG: hypothetical protein JWM14_2446 [Chitinophagaceae bacterium]|nr:hypothetical protein [Chitinophagaceae bacterium]
MKQLFIFSLIFLSVFSCTPTEKEERSEKEIADSLRTKKNIEETLKKKTDSIYNTLEERLKRIPNDTVPVLGYRFIISGDFDGDGKKEKLTEHYHSELTHKETNKYYNGLDYDQQVDITVQKYPYSFVLSDNPKIDTLPIANTAQLFGIAYMKNEGDLNGDGTDEVSYVVDWADWSSLNSWNIATYKNKKWQTLYSFAIWDWQLPGLPESNKQYGLFGTQGHTIITDDTLNDRIEEELLNFKGMVKKIKMNKIQVIYRTEEADEDSMVIDLKKLPLKK